MDEQLTIGFDRNYTPSELNKEVRLQLESNFSVIWVEGEISNLSQPASGHSYFSLKDESSQLRCALFRQHRLKVRFELATGAQVRVRGRVSLYEARGDYQLIADRVELAGTGQLLQQFQQLKRQLSAEGLFDAGRKQRLPESIRQLAVVTSPTGAAVRDVLKVLKQRYPLVQVTVIPSVVQGEQAPRSLLRALQKAQDLPVDAVLLTRGGGSIEDLWAFNDEGLARAIAASRLPVVSAIGHEIDTTIADYVADHSAPTPSAAAAMLTPDREELFRRLQVKEKRLLTQVQARLERGWQRFDDFDRQLRRKDPRTRLQQAAQRLRSLGLRLPRTTQGRLHALAQELEKSRHGLRLHDPRQRLKGQLKALASTARRLQMASQSAQQSDRHRLGAAVAKLDALSPLAVLQRGYSLTTDEAGQVVHDASRVRAGSRIHTRLAKGELVSEVVDRSD